MIRQNSWLNELNVQHLKFIIYIWINLSCSTCISQSDLMSELYTNSPSLFISYGRTNPLSSVIRMRVFNLKFCYLSGDTSTHVQKAEYASYPLYGRSQVHRPGHIFRPYIDTCCPIWRSAVIGLKWLISWWRLSYNVNNVEYLYSITNRSVSTWNRIL